MVCDLCVIILNENILFWNSMLVYWKGSQISSSLCELSYFWFGLVLGIFWWSGLANTIWSATADVWKNLRLVTLSLRKYLQNILIIALEVNKKGRKILNTLVSIIQSIVFYHSFFSFLFTVVNYQNCSYAEVTRKFKGGRDE